MTNTKTHTTMKAFKKGTISAASIKKFMKLEGVKVKSCKQLNEGVMVVVAPESREDALAFFNRYELGQSPEKFGATVVGGAASLGYIQFATVYHFIEAAYA